MFIEMQHDHVSHPPLGVAIAYRVVEVPVNQHNGDNAGKYHGKDQLSEMLAQFRYSNGLSQKGCGNRAAADHFTIIDDRNRDSGPTLCSTVLPMNVQVEHAPRLLWHHQVLHADAGVP